MAISFDHVDTIRNIYRYVSSTGIYEGIAHSAGAANFDYFKDDAVAGDYIAFGCDQGVWHDLTINVGTPLVASSLTVVWEYIAANGTWQPLTVTDPSNGFRVAGAHTISFTPPRSLTHPWVQPNIVPGFNGTLAGIGGFTSLYSAAFIRCRITAVTGLTEGGANSTTNVTCKDYTVRLYGNFTHTMADIVAASNTNGWGIATNVGKHYQLLANLWLGDGAGTTVLNSFNETVEIGGPDLYVMFRKPTVQTTFQLGQTDGTNYYNGSAWFYWNNDLPFVSNNSYNLWSGAINIYASYFWKRSGSYSDPSLPGNLQIINSTLASSFSNFSITGTGVMRNVIIEVATGLYFYHYAPNVVTSNLMFSKGNGILTGSSVTISNIDFGSAYKVTSANNNVTVTVLDCTFADPAVQVLAGGLNSQVVIQYTLLPTVIDSAGSPVSDVNIRVTNGSGVVVFNGVLPGGVVVTAGRRLSAAGSPYEDFGPFTITISKAGYETVTLVTPVTNTNRRMLVTLPPARALRFDVEGAPYFAIGAERGSEAKVVKL